ncbi:hypothetical protein CDD83_6271 [Cordyceps sp. RAO-2017]|nr:hypothetical protein CDD83_6271 [Cordyceps sp. RAO-2017]
MKSPSYALPLLAAFAGASRESYDEICPSKDGQTEPSNYGSDITYYCGKQFPREGLIDTSLSEDADICVTRCQETAGCIGISWLYQFKECQLFASGDNSLRGRRGAVSIVLTDERTVDEDYLFAGARSYGQFSIGDDYYEGQGADGLTYDSGVCTDESRRCRNCQKHLSECEEAEEKLEGSLKSCKQGSKDAEDKLDKCRSSSKKLEQDNKDLQKDKSELKKESRELKDQIAILPKPMDERQVCPAYKGMLMRQAKGTWKISCQQGSTGKVYRRTGDNFNSCLEACAKDSACKSVNYWPKNGSKRCVMFNTSAPNGGSVRDPLVGAVLVGRY